jgi:hypothetical protein
VRVSTILDSIDMANMALPEFQRGYVWNRKQVRGLMQSLYKRYPVGSLLVWTTEGQTTAMRGEAPGSGRVVKLLLDGQQRITSLYGIMRGHAPRFFQGSASAFTDLYFDLRSETFEFYGPVKMRDDPLWVNVSELFKTELQPWFTKMSELEVDGETQALYLARLNLILGIRDIDLHLEEITGADKSLDDVVDIFNRVNSGGTKLSQGDLALARICADWPEAREVMNNRLNGWAEEGFNFPLDWLLRVTNATLTGEAKFTVLRELGAEEIKTGLESSSALVDHLLNLIAGRLGLDHDRVLSGRYAFPIMARFLSQHPSSPDTATQDQLLFWYVHSFMWGRHTGSTESTLNQDLHALDEGGLDRLIEVLRRSRGDLVVRPEDFGGSERGARFYPLLYLLSRIGGARDLGSGNELSAHLLGKLSRLELHHVFPKAMLQEASHERGERNALANFCFLTQETNLAIGRRSPKEYFPEFEEKHPGVLASQWIPSDPDLWETDRYLDFLEARRGLLAAAANELLDSLAEGTRPETEQQERSVRVEVIGDTDDAVLQEIAQFAADLGLARPELQFEFVDETSGEALAMADAAWPNGLQEGLTEPIALLLEPDEEMETRLGELGFRFFTSAERLNWYLEKVLGRDLDGDGIVGVPSRG